MQQDLPLQVIILRNKPFCRLILNIVYWQLYPHFKLLFICVSRSNLWLHRKLFWCLHRSRNSSHYISSCYDISYTEEMNPFVKHVPYMHKINIQYISRSDLMSSTYFKNDYDLHIVLMFRDRENNVWYILCFSEIYFKKKLGILKISILIISRFRYFNNWAKRCCNFLANRKLKLLRHPFCHLLSSWECPCIFVKGFLMKNRRFPTILM